MADTAVTRISLAFAFLFLVLACVLLVLWVVGIRQWWSRQSTPRHRPTHVGFFMIGLGLVTVALTASTVHHTKVAECNIYVFCPWVVMLWCSTILFAMMMISISVFLVPLVLLLRKRRNRAETTLATIFSTLCLLVFTLPVSLTAYLRSHQTCAGAAASEGMQMHMPPGENSWHVKPEPPQEEPEQQEQQSEIASSFVAPVDIRQLLEDMNDPGFFRFVDNMVQNADPTEMAALMEVREETWIPFLQENCFKQETVSPPCVAVLSAIALLEPDADPSIWAHGRTLEDLTVALLKTLNLLYKDLVYEALLREDLLKAPLLRNDLLHEQTPAYGQDTLQALLLILKNCLQHVQKEDYEHMSNILQNMTTNVTKVKTTKETEAKRTRLLKAINALKNVLQERGAK